MVIISLGQRYSKKKGGVARVLQPGGSHGPRDRREQGHSETTKGTGQGELGNSDVSENPPVSFLQSKGLVMGLSEKEREVDL